MFAVLAVMYSESSVALHNIRDVRVFRRRCLYARLCRDQSVMCYPMPCYAELLG